MNVIEAALLPEHTMLLFTRLAFDLELASFINRDVDHANFAEGVKRAKEVSERFPEDKLLAGDVRAAEDFLRLRQEPGATTSKVSLSSQLGQTYSAG